MALQFFGGHPESNFHLLAVTVVFFAFRLVVLRREGALPDVRAPGCWPSAAASSGGTALAAILLVPFLELLFRSGDVEVRESFAQHRAARAATCSGSRCPTTGAGRPSAAVGDFTQVRALYVGALPLVLAAAALVVRPTLLRAGVAVFGALMLADRARACRRSRRSRRGSRSSRPATTCGCRSCVMLCLALLAGWGLDDLSEGACRAARLVLGSPRVLLVAPVLVLAARGELSAGLLGRGARDRVGLLVAVGARRRGRRSRPSGWAR